MSPTLIVVCLVAILIFFACIVDEIIMLGETGGKN
jgi:hypothetical protein